MFTHPVVKDDALVRVVFAQYAERHFLKDFEKRYRGRQWQVTLESILADIGRVKKRDNVLQQTQQVDELWHKGDKWIFKYDFAVAQTRKSAKASGNRCVVFMDAKKNEAQILLIYAKDNVPKKMGEQKWIEGIVREEFGECYREVVGV